MFNIDSSIFMSKLTKFGIHAVPDNRKMKDNVCSFFFPKLYDELPDLIMNCVCDGNTDSILFALSVPIHELPIFKSSRNYVATLTQ